MSACYVPLVLLAALLFSDCSRAEAGATTGVTCLTTLPPVPAFIPPPPYPRDMAAETFWYGSDSLWTKLSIDGVWSMANNVLHGNGYRTKLIYWQKGFNWREDRQPKLTVTAARLDREMPPVTAEKANAIFVTGQTPAIMTGIDIPSAGCWEITGQYRGQSLSFVVLVVP